VSTAAARAANASSRVHQRARAAAVARANSCGEATNAESEAARYSSVSWLTASAAPSRVRWALAHADVSTSRTMSRGAGHIARWVQVVDVGVGRAGAEKVRAPRVPRHLPQPASAISVRELHTDPRARRYPLSRRA
jgi:hypothetical protein